SLSPLWADGEIQNDIELGINALVVYLRQQPKDARGFMALGRLLRLQLYKRLQFEGKEAGPLREQVDAIVRKREATYRAANGALDRAIALDSKIAAAYYAKGLLLGMPVSPFLAEVDSAAYEKQQAERIGYFRKSADLEPTDFIYNSALVGTLAVAGAFDEATMVAQRMSSNSPAYKILADFKAVPIPDSAIYASDLSKKAVESGLGQTSFPALRVRAYVVPSDVRDLDTYYQQRWPTFRFSAGQKCGECFRQYMRLIDGALQPTSEDLDVDPSKMGGRLLIEVDPGRELSQENRERLHLQLGIAYTVLLVVDML
ncbi:MAG TPA: hypothetical protein VHZ01_13890, partial [Casimicrobiaceae bacterium]|nr:hypothetical protein [Casimicrobiaceae bacterium]